MADSSDRDDGAASPRKNRILVVDDDEDTAETLALLLSEHYTVDTAANGAEAVERVDARSYDAIVLDLMMPVMDGATFKQVLERRHLTVPVLLTSASADLRERAAELAVDDFLAKPIDVNVLEERLARLVTGSRAHPPRR